MEGEVFFRPSQLRLRGFFVPSHSQLDNTHDLLYNSRTRIFGHGDNRSATTPKESKFMTQQEKIVDGFRFMSPALAAWIRQGIPEEPYAGRIPWTPLKRPLKEATFSLMTSAGVSMKTDPPFDMDRERREPSWGDPTHREIPRDATENDVAVNHLHIKTDYIEKDLNVTLPTARFAELEARGVIGKLAPTSYSYYGFQIDPEVLLEETMPKVAARMYAEGVDAVLLTPV